MSIRTRNVSFDVNVEALIADVQNYSIGTAENAMPYLHFKGVADDEILAGADKAGARVCWADPLIESLNADDISITPEPDEVAQILRKRFFTSRSIDIHGGSSAPVVLAFAVEGAKSAVLPTDFESAYPFPCEFKEAALYIGMKDAEGSTIALKDFVFLKWNDIRRREEEGVEK